MKRFYKSNLKKLPPLLMAGLFGFFLLYTHVAVAQNGSITLNIQNGTIEQVINEVEKQTNYRFIYNKSQIDVKQKKTVKFTNAIINEVLLKLFANTEIAYEVNGQQVILSKKSEMPPQSKKSTLKGVILDVKGEPIIGATIRLEGNSSLGTISDYDGVYTLENVPEDGVVQISYIGYQPVSVAVNKAGSIVLKEDHQLLDEVVVIGYGVMNKRDVSTSISSMKSDDIANVPISDFRQSMVGKMPGVQVLQSSGDPEGNVTIRVRGLSSVTAGNDPLYVVDGIPVERGLSNVNSNDIESIEVLKDASAAAIYGSRGSNGVIIVTTKKGTTDKLSVSYSGYFGTQSVSKKIDLMNAYEFAEVAKDGHNNAYLDEIPGASIDDPNLIRPQGYHQIPTELFPYLEGKTGLTDTDWQGAIFRSAITTSHNISLSGKSDKINYFISGGYLFKEGVVIESDYEKYNLRLNLDGKSGKFKYGVNFSPSYSKSNRVDASGPYGSGGIISSALTMPPVWPVYNDDGSFNYQGNGYWRIGTDYQHNPILNPVALAKLQNDVVDRMALNGKVYGEYEFMDGLSYNFSLGGEFYGAHNDRYRQSNLPFLGQQYYDKKSNPTGYSSSSFFYNWVVENRLNYNKVFDGKHRVNAIAVQSAQKEIYKGNSVTATDYPNDYIQTITGGTVSKGYSEVAQWTLASYLARVQYSYEGRYLASAAIRTDGSSRFGSNHRWGYFPSASAAWRLSDENFIKDNNSFSFLDDFKLKASYGETGNFQIGNYEHLATMGIENYILGVGNGQLVTGYKPESIMNEDLRWEKTGMVNFGFDAQMFNGLFNIYVDFYNSNTKDMLLNVPVPYITGYGTTRMNIGKVNNKGIDILVSSAKTFNNGFNYNLSANFSKNINEVVELGPGNAPIISTGSVNHAYYITEVGKPIGSYYLLVQDGIFSTSEELTQYPHFDNTRVGDFRFVDVNKDGVLDLDNDRTVVGNYMPDFTYGFSGDFAFKGVDLALAFQGVYGNEILNLNRRYIDNMEGNVNGTREALNRWVNETNPGNGEVNRANRKSKGYNGRTSTWHIEDGSYLRLQNVSIGYTFPKKVTERFSMSNLRIYLSGQNLWTLTNYSGYNPEVSSRPNSSLSPGEDYGTYPLAKTITIGLNLTL